MKILVRPKPAGDPTLLYLAIYDLGYTKVRNQRNGACLEVENEKAIEPLRKKISKVYKGEFGIYKEEQ